MKKIFLPFVFSLLSLIVCGQVTVPTGVSTEVGITEGQLSVSLKGGANYSVPIAVPPGINGVVPQISLSYNSQSGNGLAGYGWNISGLSAISRIPRTKFHDDVVGGVNLDSNDRFAFDGQRLIVKAFKTDVYGAAGTVYETESFSNLKITSYGVNPNGANYGPAYFIVEYPDGSKAYYGNSADSLSLTDWAITYWENPQGVRISYSYTLANNLLSIASIQYGATGSTAGINRINFVYKPAGRQRPEQAYIGGQSFINNKLLGEIDVVGNNVGFRYYVLNHDVTSLGYERIINITEKSGDNTKNYNPTVFSYATTPEVITYNPAPSSISTPGSTTGIGLDNSSTVSGDFDGDGKMDFLLYPTTGTDAKKKYWLFNNIQVGVSNTGILHNIGAFNEIVATAWLDSNNKLVKMQGWCAILTDPTTLVTSFKSYSYVVAAAATNPIYLQDIKDYTFPTITKIAQTRMTCLGISTGQKQTITIPKDYLSGDFDGDGLTDIIVVERNYNYSDTYAGCMNDKLISVINTPRTYIGNSYFVLLDKRVTTNFINMSGQLNIDASSKLIVADVNGDGKSDLLVFNTGTVKVYSLNDAKQIVLLFTTNDVSIALDKPILMGDYNGDGKMDFIIPKGYGNNYAHFTSTGINFTKADVTYDFSYSQNNQNNTYQLIPNDVNNDGKTDIVLALTAIATPGSNLSGGGITYKTYGNMGSSFSLCAEKTYGLDNTIQAFPIPIFLSADKANQNQGMNFITGNRIFHFESQKNLGIEKLLKTITTGNGVKESISYQPLDPTAQEGSNFIYTNSTNTEVYPNFDIAVAPSFQVVSKLEKQSTSVYKKQLFAYSAAVSNLVGIGFLGFRSTMRTNWIDNSPATPILSSVSKSDISLRGANIENYQVLNWAIPSSSFAPTTYISKSVLGYTTATDALQTNKVFKLQNTSLQTFNGLESTSSQTTTQYDAYNNPTQATTTLSNGTTLEQTSTSAVIYDNQPTGSPYYIGRPTSKTQTVTLNTTGDTTTSNELYAYTNHLLSQVKKYGNGTTDFITEDNFYDAFGNITQKKITAPAVAPNPAPAARVTNYEYDLSGRFLTKSTDIEGLATIFAYNSNNGILNSETNPYGLTTSYLYDSWFKKVKTTDYLGKSNTYAYSRIGNVNTLVTTTGDDGSLSSELFDDLGRKMTASVKNINGVNSSVAYKYDIYDRTVQVSEPYFGTAPSNWNNKVYDQYGRLSSSTPYTGRPVTMSYTGLTTLADDGSKTKTAIKNALGKVVSMTDAPGGAISYTYYANGNLKTSSYSGAITSISQDAWGRKTQLVDPSAGTYSYKYNGFGETTSETTPNGTTTYGLNDVGKLATKTISGTNTNSKTIYNYDAASKLLTSSVFTNLLGGSAVTTNTYSYDGSKRLVGTTEVAPFATFSKQILTFDGFGRVLTENTSGTTNGKTSSKTVQNTYQNGYPYQILDYANQTVLWQTNTVNERGQLATAKLGNGIAITNTYDTHGFATQFKHDRTLTNPGNVMTLGTTFNAVTGNLTSRTNTMFGLTITDNFTYDTLDRLTGYPNVLGTPVTQNYDDQGRITNNNLGTYNYTNTAKTYQNTSITPTSPSTVLAPEVLTYYTAKPIQKISYNSFKSPVVIEDVGIDKISFTYNDNNSRSKMTSGGVAYNTPIITKYYSADGSMEIKQNASTGVLEFTTYIGGDGYTAPIILRSDGTTQNYLYLHRDYQGSILAITDATGTVLEKRLFDAWGSIAQVQDGAGNLLNVLTILDRGYTGHEHLQSVGLIDMNARLYDPKLHRFLQPDNYVQDPGNTQNYNRYGYVLNNPLAYTDPNGEKIKFGFKDLIAGLQVVVGAVLLFVPGAEIIGGALLVNGLSYFKSTNDQYKVTGDWGAASQNSSIMFGFKIDTDWGYVSKPGGVTQSEPTVTPKTVDQVKQDKGDNSFHPGQYLPNFKSDIGFDFFKFKGMHYGVPEFESSWMTGGAMTPGSFVIYPTGGSSNPYYNTHEDGHVLQFALMGKYYYPLIAIPSAIYSYYHTTREASQFYTEKTANQLWYWWSGEYDKRNPVYRKN